MDQIVIRLTAATDGSVGVVCELDDNRFEHLAARPLVESLQLSADSLLANCETALEPLVGIGTRLRDAFLEPFYGEILTGIRPGHGRLLVVSESAELLRLPWETLPDASAGFLFPAGSRLVLRTSLGALQRPPARLPAPPLRIVFCVCAPLDLEPFDFEREEEAAVQMGYALGAGAHVEIIETGTFDEVKQRVDELKPQVVLLVGHSTIQGRGGQFAFENERGLADLRNSSAIADGLLAGKGVRLLILCGSRGSQAGAGALCQILTMMNHVAAGLAWSESLAEELPRRFLQRFLKDVGQGRNVIAAALAAQKPQPGEAADNAAGDETAPAEEELETRYAWQQFYSSEDETSLVDRALTVSGVVRPAIRYELLGDNICGMREGFVGRRRLLQRTHPALRDGERQVLFLTGISGSGRSTVAARLAGLCKKDGFEVVGIQARRDDASQFCMRVLGKLAVTYERLGKTEDQRLMSNGQQSVETRLREAVDTLNRNKILLLLDNLDDLLTVPPEAAGWLSADAGRFFADLFTRLNGQGRVIITASQVPVGTDLIQPRVAQEALPEFSESDFFKFVRRQPEVAVRMERGELPQELLSTFHRRVGVTPRFVKQACSVLGKLTAKGLAERLEKIEDGLSAEEQQARFRDLFLVELFNTLPPESKVGLSRISLVEMPLPIDGISRVAGLVQTKTEKVVEQWFNLGLVLQFSSEKAVRLYSVHPLQREFYTHPSRLAPDQVKAGHLAAAILFRDCFEVNREEELGWSVTAELLACLRHATTAGDQDMRRWAALRLSRRLQGKSEYRAALEFIEPLVREADKG